MYEPDGSTAAIQYRQKLKERSREDITLILLAFVRTAVQQLDEKDKNCNRRVQDLLNDAKTRAEQLETIRTTCRGLEARLNQASPSAEVVKDEQLQASVSRLQAHVQELQSQHASDLEQVRQAKLDQRAAQERLRALHENVAIHLGPSYQAVLSSMLDVKPTTVESYAEEKG